MKSILFVALVASTAFAQKPDLANTGSELLDAARQNPSRAAYLGETRTVRITTRNAGTVNATAFHNAAFLSTDRNLSLAPVGTDLFLNEAPAAALNAGATSQLTVDVTFPSTGANGKPLPTGDYYVLARLDSQNEVDELNEANNDFWIGPVRLSVPAPDFAVSKVLTGSSTAAGETLTVTRTLRNVGVVDGPAVQYRYVLSANNLITEEDIPLDIVDASGNGAATGQVSIAYGGFDTRTELLRIPSNVPAGSYYVGVIVDSANAVEELDEVNNARPTDQTITIAGFSVRVTTASLPDAVNGRDYVFQLAATGVTAQAKWTATGLPSGLTLSSQGILSGRPDVVGVFGIGVTVTDTAGSASSALALRVQADGAGFAFNTVSLPAMTIGLAYSARLSAAGGSMPYTFRIVSGALPAGIVLTSAGVLTGTATGPAGQSSITFEARDALGMIATATLRARVIASGSVSISTLLLPNGAVGQDYITDVAATLSDASARPLTWSLAAGSLPEGLTFVSSNGDRGILSGVPARAGSFRFALQVTDAYGRSDTADYVLMIFGEQLTLTAAGLPDELHPGDDVSVSFHSNSDAAAKFSLYSGSLPAGLTLDESGVLSGVLEESAEGDHTIVIQARDSRGAEGLAAFELRVRPAVRAGGCSTTGGSGAIAAAILAAAVVVLRKRRSNG